VTTETTPGFEFWFDVGSPYSYVAWKALPALEARTGAKAALRPMLLGGVFKATGNRSPVEVPAKGRWTDVDLARWAHRVGAPFERNPWFPVNTLALMRGAAGLRLRDPDALPRYLEAVFAAMWARPRNLGDPAEVARTLAEAGFDARSFVAMIEDPEVKDALKRDTEEAVARGVFGAPTFFVGDELFFGQDRMDFVAEALAARRT
jgi:2-hydroxychromene-2-carboxylate isomerase